MCRGIIKIQYVGPQIQRPRNKPSQPARMTNKRKWILPKKFHFHFRRQNRKAYHPINWREGGGTTTYNEIGEELVTTKKKGTTKHSETCFSLKFYFLLDGLLSSTYYWDFKDISPLHMTGFWFWLFGFPLSSVETTLTLNRTSRKLIVLGRTRCFESSLECLKVERTNRWKYEQQKDNGNEQRLSTA